jgi:hypothetical protein
MTIAARGMTSRCARHDTHAASSSVIGITPRASPLAPLASSLAPRPSHPSPRPSRLTPRASPSRLVPRASPLAPRPRASPLASSLAPRPPRLAPRAPRLVPRASHPSPRPSRLAPRASPLAPLPSRLSPPRLSLHASPQMRDKSRATPSSGPSPLAPLIPMTGDHPAWSPRAAREVLHDPLRFRAALGMTRMQHFQS